MGHIFIKQGSNQGSTMSPGDYYPSTLGKIASGNITALFGWSSSVTLFTPDNYMTSANIIANYAKSTNLYNKNWIDTLSGSIDTRIDTLEGYDVFDSTLYITSTSAISRFAPSGIWKKVGDSIYYSGTSKKVGIGTTNPLYPLHVLSGAAFGLQAVSPNLRGFVNIELTPDDGLGYTQALKMHANKTGISTLYGFNGTVIGANTTNIAIYGYADGATNNYGLYIEAGNALFKEDMYIEGNLSSQAISTQSISSNIIKFTEFTGKTDATAAELEELTDGSETTLHTHAAVSDVAWSGASEFYGFSSNATSLYAPSGDYENIVTVAKSGAHFTSIQDAIDSITDNSSSKPYSIMIYPGVYTEDIKMEDWVSLDGEGKRSDIIISGTLYFASDAGNKSAIRDLTIAYNTSTDNTHLISASGGRHSVDNCRLILSNSENGHIGSLGRFSGTTFRMRRCWSKYDFDGTAAGTNSHWIFDFLGTTTWSMWDNEFQIEISDAGDTAALVNEATTFTVESYFDHNTVDMDMKSASYNGTCGILYLHGAGTDKHVNYNHLHLTSAGNGTSYAVYMDTAGNNGEVHCLANDMHIEDFANNYGFNVASGDEITSHFDGMAEGMSDGTGAGTLKMVHAHDDDLDVTGHIFADGAISGTSVSGGTIKFTTFTGKTNATATELETLTDGSDADSLHIHLGYYPSSLGKGISSQVLALTDWYNASGEKLSTISGSLSTKINTKQDLLDGSEYYPSSLGRGISSQVLANMKHSANSALHSFSVDLYMTSTNIITNYAKSANLYNQAWVDAFSGNIDTRLDAIVSFTPESYMTSANIISNYAASTTLIGKYSPSNQTRYGWGEVSDGGTIAHTCSSKPSWVSIAPSGANPISYAFTVDATNITVRHTSPDSETFSWRAVV